MNKKKNLKQKIVLLLIWILNYRNKIKVLKEIKI